jgi:hypothetical protein
MDSSKSPLNFAEAWMSYGYLFIEVLRDLGIAEGARHPVDRHAAAGD